MCGDQSTIRWFVSHIVHPNEPSPVSPTSGPAWQLVRSTIEQSHPGTIVTPYVMMAASDSRYFARTSDFVYRFSPFEMSTDAQGSLQVIDERMHVSTFLRGVDFYTRLVGRR